MTNQLEYFVYNLYPYGWQDYVVLLLLVVGIASIFYRLAWLVRKLAKGRLADGQKTYK